MPRPKTFRLVTAMRMQWPINTSRFERRAVVSNDWQSFWMTGDCFGWQAVILNDRCLFQITGSRFEWRALVSNNRQSFWTTGGCFELRFEWWAGPQPSIRVFRTMGPRSNRNDRPLFELFETMGPCWFQRRLVNSNTGRLIRTLGSRFERRSVNLNSLNYNSNLYLYT